MATGFEAATPRLMTHRCGTGSANCVQTYVVSRLTFLVFPTDNKDSRITCTFANDAASRPLGSPEMSDTFRECAEKDSFAVSSSVRPSVRPSKVSRCDYFLIMESGNDEKHSREIRDTDFPRMKEASYASNVLLLARRDLLLRSE